LVISAVLTFQIQIQERFIVITVEIEIIRV
jgi:hypothetical protein